MSGFLTKFNQGIEGLLGSPMGNLGLGLLANSGPGYGPAPSFGQVLGQATQFANQNMSQYQQLQAQRAALQQQKAQQNALKQIGLLTSGTQPPASIAAPQNLMQQRMQGLLAQANPQAYSRAMIESMFTKPQQAPNAIREVQQLTGLQPGTPEFLEAYQSIKGQQPTPLEQAQLAQITQSLNQSMQDSQFENSERQRNNNRRVVGTESTLNKVDEILNKFEEVQGTLAETGAWSQVIAAGAGVLDRLGVDGASDIAEDLQVQGKKLTELATGSIPDAFLGSDSRIGFYQQQLANTDLQPGANLEIMKSLLADLINEERVENGLDAETPRTRRARELIERINEMLSPAPPDGFVLDK